MNRIDNVAGLALSAIDKLEDKKPAAASQYIVESATDEEAPIQQPAPAAPDFSPMPAWRAAIYAGSSIFLGITQGLGVNLVTANLSNLQAQLSATQLEMGWLSAAYFATNIAGTILMFKVRTQFGLRGFAEVGILVFVAAVIAHLFTNDLHSAVLVRAIMGVAAAPLSTLAFYYMLEWLPPARKMSIGICFG
ncbi:MAG: transporter, partial [Cypionkella sp.]|uniref:MFS transporter n=1 Tax=Cypionkella sp. TaxID=2811411 RepID=UPI0026349589